MKISELILILDILQGKPLIGLPYIILVYSYTFSCFATLAAKTSYRNCTIDRDQS